LQRISDKGGERVTSAAPQGNFLEIFRPKVRIHINQVLLSRTKSHTVKVFELGNDAMRVFQFPQKKPNNNNYYYETLKSEDSSTSEAY
jgi:hypothetical protein